jgi:hypothetical protein
MSIVNRGKRIGFTGRINNIFSMLKGNLPHRLENKVADNGVVIQSPLIEGALAKGELSSGKAGVKTEDSGAA